MRYTYECINRDCKELKKEVIITKPISECSTDEFCSECKSKLSKIFAVIPKHLSWSTWRAV